MENPETIRLRQRLPEQSELLRLNRRLHANEICLDWCNVRLDLVTPEQLDTLLHGLNLSEHSSCIDASNNTAVSDALFPLIMQAFERAENDPDATITRPVRTDAQNYPTPRLWTPPDLQNEVESTIIRKWHPERKTFINASAQAAHIEMPMDNVAGAYRPPFRFLPVYELPCNETSHDTSSPTSVDSRLDMSRLKQAERGQLPTLLQPLVNTYKRWIEEQARHVTNSTLNRTQDRLHLCTKEQQAGRHTTLQRIQESIGLISADWRATQAFTFMNQVMELQLLHSSSIQERSGTVTPTSTRRPPIRNWHPFQLAFILLNIPALLDASLIDRNATYGALADLRWFPTSWEKTDAYLGLTAYTLGIRRLQDRSRGSLGAGSVTAILRTTSCELTSHQFQRIVAVTCTCEVIRRDDSSLWGTIPFLLGLPANLQPMLTHCPWCGSTIERSQEHTNDPNNFHARIYCRDPKNECPFCRAKSPYEGLPILVIEKDIQHLKPTLLITEAT